MTNTKQIFDPYGKTHTLDKPIIEAIATRLEARGRQPDFQRMLTDYVEAMEIDRAQNVLDMGCGTGFAARNIAARPTFSGQVVGIDISPDLVTQAAKLAGEEGLANLLEFRVGDTHSLDLADNSFDAVIAHTLISHVPEPLQVLQEMARVVKPGGLVGIYDGDYASFTFSHPDPEQGKIMDELVISSIITQPRVMRQMPRLLKQVGLELVTAYSYVVADISRADYWASSVESMRKLLPAAGTMTAEDANAWVEARMQESDEGVFFASSNYISYVAQKPE